MRDSEAEKLEKLIKDAQARFSPLSTANKIKKPNFPERRSIEVDSCKPFIPCYGLRYGGYMHPLHGASPGFLMYHFITTGIIGYGIYKGVSAFL